MLLLPFVISSLLVALSAGQYAYNSVYSGSLQVVTQDYFTSAPVRDYFILIDGETEATRLSFPGGVPAALAHRTPENGDRIQVTGSPVQHPLGKEISALAVSIGKPVRRADSYPKLGAKKVLVVVMQFSDGASAAAGVTTANTMVFGSGNVTGASLSVKGRYETCSNNQMTMPAQTVLGPVVLSYSKTSYESTCSNYNVWASDAYNKIKASLTTTYDIYAFVLPPEAIAGCAIGRGHVCLGGCTPSSSSAFPRTWIRYDYNRPDCYSHEFGHNFGLHHSGIGSDEYADQSSTMGYADNVQKCFNGPNMYYFGWYSGKTSILDFSTGSLGTQTVTLTALSEIALGAPLYIVKVITPTGTPLFLEYRVKTKGDLGLSTTYASKTGVVFWLGDMQLTGRNASLADGQSFTSAAVNIVITQVSHTATTSTVTIGLALTTTTAIPTTTVSTTTGIPTTTGAPTTTTKNPKCRGKGC